MRPEDVTHPVPLEAVLEMQRKLRDANLPSWRALRAMEVMRGHRWVRVGSVPWLPSSDWHEHDCISLDGDEVRLVAIAARKPGTGAFRKLIWAIEAAGLKPVVICPVGRIMPAIMKRWGWVETRAGHNFETWEDQWRPPAPVEGQGEATAAAGSPVPDDAAAPVGGPDSSQGRPE